MIFLFGWGHISKSKINKTPIQICEHCHKNYLYLTRILSWFTFFFIPIFPYKIKYYILCANCEYGFEICKKELGKIIKNLEEKDIAENFK